MHLLFLMALVILVGILFDRPFYGQLSYLSFCYLLLLWLIPSWSLYGIPRNLSYFREAFLPPDERRNGKEACRYFKSLSLNVVLGSLVIAGAAAGYWFINLTDYNDLGRFLEIMILTPYYGLLTVLGVFLPLWTALEREESSS